MQTGGILERAGAESLSDEEIVARVKAGDTALYEIIMRRYNQRLYRVAVAVLRDYAEAEDVIQEAYVSAYQHLDQFAGRSAFPTWLTRIAVHEALRRIRLRNRNVSLDDVGDDGEALMNDVAETSPNPEQNASRTELSQLLEETVLGLPSQFRTVIMLREVEGLSISEIAATLDLTEENVKVRLHRGRALARGVIVDRIGTNAKSAFPFMGARCDSVVRVVLSRIADLGNIPHQVQ
jgi:RNA polymerase sigma-70 factor (ECF subfamily)